MEDRADTVPGFVMQSELFYLKFITGLQCGVSSKLLEYETDWYEVMEILLSRLQVRNIRLNSRCSNMFFDKNVYSIPSLLIILFNNYSFFRMSRKARTGSS